VGWALWRYSSAKWKGHIPQKAKDPHPCRKERGKDGAHAVMDAAGLSQRLNAATPRKSDRLLLAGY
jgi:hypothetical protein